MAKHIPHQRDKTPHKTIKHKLSFVSKLWQLRYRFYALIVIFMLPALLIASDSNTKDIVPPDSGYKVSYEGFLASKISKETKQNKYIQSQIEESKTIILATKDEPQKEQESKSTEKPLANTSVVKDGQIKAYATDGKEITESFINSSLYKEYIKGTDNNKKPRKTLDELIKKPEQGLKYSYLNYPKYKIQTPIQWANFESIYQKDISQKANSFDFEKIIQEDPTAIAKGDYESTPTQKLLKDGIVHLGFTVQPGEVGNSYIVGHSSNFSAVKSDYNYIFKPIQEKSQVGEEFFIYDQVGRELKFCVFDTLKIEESDIKEAYKEYPDKRVVTLQTSILTWKDGQIKPTHRWLTRGELCNDKKTPQIPTDFKKLI